MYIICILSRLKYDHIRITQDLRPDTICGVTHSAINACYIHVYQLEQEKVVPTRPQARLTSRLVKVKGCSNSRTGVGQGSLIKGMGTLSPETLITLLQPATSTASDKKKVIF